MRRREFIVLGGKFSLGTLAVPSLLTTSCRKEKLFEDTNFNGKVIIVGAGAAGLYAGYILKSKGIDFEILEASSVYGGRLGKLENFADFPLDTGAQWLHGKRNVVGDLIQTTRTQIRLDNSDQVYWFNGKLVSSLPREVDKVFEEQVGLPDISFKDYGVQQGLGEEYEFIIENLAGDQGAAAAQLSVAENVKEEEDWFSGDEDYKFKATFFDLFEQEIIPSVKDNIRLSAQVIAINYSLDKTIISTKDGNDYSTDKVIITVPITILQDEDVQFFPPLPTGKIDAFRKIGMGAGMKIFLKFSETFYPENIIGGKVCAAYADERTGKSGNDSVLLAFVMGEQAEYLNTLGTDQQIIDAILEELDLMFEGKASQHFEKAHVQNWTNHPFIKGAYSYSKVGIGNARTIAAESVNETLFFAGEAMNLNGHHQTVHGAVESGIGAVINILNTEKQ